MKSRMNGKMGIAGTLLLLTIVSTACGSSNDANNGAANGGNAASTNAANTAATNGAAANDTAAASNAAADANTATNAAANASADATTADKGTLTVYLNDFDDIVKPMFEAQTGYKLNIVSGNGAEIMSRIEAEKGNPHWDVVWMDAMPSIQGLDKQGELLTGWTPAAASGLTDFAKSFVPSDNSYFPTGAHAAGVIVYNKNEIKAEDAPKTWKDFTDAKYKGQIGMADPAVAAPAYPFVSWFFQDQGMDAGKSYFSSLLKNGLHVYPKNPNVVSALSGGEIKVAALQESNAYVMKNGGEPIEIIWPQDGAPASVRVAAIQKDTKHADAAKAFVEFLLDPKTQQALIDKGDESYFEPSVTGATAKADREANAKLVVAKADWAADHEAEIKQWFSDQSVK
ncbi:ABC transporter substrate-binding protein [Paenibacillus lycopersici]|uniref:ABC transporter substrate-binding protein n=1 Tax=Paenibacillus lycopersici TaxID=2704462 RepID=A0A6C0G232_9BACL|nr:ABC transporter substrate-binding protein [Paenibacillus lycopersici]QHT63528.1 ABC transporter substrate-binding protein [Paenibacillus lycopersici]